jgi:thioredoxin-like negative regulator of GroEL
MGVSIKSKAVLNNVLQMDFRDNIVFIKFGTDWCIPCQELDKILINVPNSIVYHVNLENTEFDDVMEEYNFATIPYTIIKYKKEINNFKGVITQEQINKLIDDMKS